MNWLYEQQIVIFLLGAVLILALAGAWSATGRREFLYGIAAAFVLMIAGMIVERMVVTDREAIRATLLHLARDLQTNNRQAVVEHISASAPELRKKAQSELPGYTFSECRITKIHTIDVNDRAEPRTAVVQFNVIASGSFKYGGFEVSDSRVPRWIELQMVKEPGGRWTIEDYDHAPPQQMSFQNR